MSENQQHLPAPTTTSEPGAKSVAMATDLAPGSCQSSTERGQSTAEYALVLLGAGTIAMMVVAWASSSNQIGRLLDAVFESLIGLVT